MSYVVKMFAAKILVGKMPTVKMLMAKVLRTGWQLH